MKVDWDTYFITQCFLISMRSTDTTKHGAIIVDGENRVLSCGYNGHIVGIDDGAIPQTRPEKYPYKIHAEENAILFLNGNIQPGTKIYITGRPCHKCVRMILQKGIRNIIYGPQESVCVDLEDIKATDNMIRQTNANFTKYNNITALQSFSTSFLKRINELCV